MSLTLKLYKLSRNYRHVQQILSKEKKAQKQSACGLLIDEDAEDFFTCRQSILSELLQAMWFAFIANTEAICYLIIFLYTILSRNLLALPIPIMVLLWGSLSIPRPSKRFWFTIIVYAQVKIIFATLLIRLEQLFIFNFTKKTSIFRCWFSCNTFSKFFR